MVSGRYIGGYPGGPSQTALPTRFSKIRFDPSLIGCERGAPELQRVCAYPSAAHCKNAHE